MSKYSLESFMYWWYLYSLWWLPIWRKTLYFASWNTSVFFSGLNTVPGPYIMEIGIVDDPILERERNRYTMVSPRDKDQKEIILVSIIQLWFWSVLFSSVTFEIFWSFLTTASSPSSSPAAIPSIAAPSSMLFASSGTITWKVKIVRVTKEHQQHWKHGCS